MITLTKTNGKKVILNTNVIAIIEPTEENKTQIFLSFSGYYSSIITVEEDIQKVLDMIKLDNKNKK